MAVTLQDLQGASKTIGKFNCICQLFFSRLISRWICTGNAVGNTCGFGDEPMIDLPALHRKGKVMVYISSSD